MTKKRFCKRFVQSCSETYRHEFQDALANMESFIWNELSGDAEIIALTGDSRECLLVYLDKDTKRS